MVHSPFVYQWNDEILPDTKKFYAFIPIEKLRNKLLQDETKLNILDLGAGSKKLTSHIRKIKDIVATSSRSAHIGRLLFRIINHWQPKVMIELGTNLGIGSLYMHAACRQSKFYTIEACPSIATQARLNFESLDALDIQLINKEFTSALPSILSHEKIDLALIDGNHTEAATMQYFEMFKKIRHEKMLLIFDDIYWSRGMTAAWNSIKNDDTVKVTIDLFDIGLVFFKTDQPKENFVIRYDGQF